MHETHLLVGISGSLAVLSMPDHLTALKAEFPNLKIIMTHSATQFIPLSTLSMFSESIYASEFPISKDNMSHVELARWADLFIVMPATANVIGEVAGGLAGSLLTATVLTFEKNVIFFPNMNLSMWKKQSVQRNLSVLENDGHRVVPPIEKMGFEYASKEIRPNLMMPSTESVLSILKLELEVGV
ncbi:MAG: Mersacidin decarboxylase [Chlamydiae bacterium]|nr:Mersacidin decarboxylase [Chlamydiota bacterium]